VEALQEVPNGPEAVGPRERRRAHVDQLHCNQPALLQETTNHGESCLMSRKVGGSGSGRGEAATVRAAGPARAPVSQRPSARSTRTCTLARRSPPPPPAGTLLVARSPLPLTARSTNNDPWSAAGTRHLRCVVLVSSLRDLAGWSRASVLSLREGGPPSEPRSSRKRRFRRASPNVPFLARVGWLKRVLCSALSRLRSRPRRFLGCWHVMLSDLTSLDGWRSPSRFACPVLEMDLAALSTDRFTSGSGLSASFPSDA
jgi:hypothetical protein